MELYFHQTWFSVHIWHKQSAHIGKCYPGAAMEMTKFIHHSVNNNTRPTNAPFRKEDEVLSKILYELKGHNAWQFEFQNKSWTE